MSIASSSHSLSTMSGSSRRTSNHSHSRQSRPRDDLDLTVTEAGLQSLALAPSGSNQRYQIPISQYQVPDQQFDPQSFDGSGPSSTYLQPSRGSVIYPTVPSPSYAQNPLTYPTIAEPQHSPAPNLYGEERFLPEPPAMPGPEMR